MLAALPSPVRQWAQWMSAACLASPKDGSSTMCQAAHPNVLHTEGRGCGGSVAGMEMFWYAGRRQHCKVASHRVSCTGLMSSQIITPVH